MSVAYWPSAAAAAAFLCWAHIHTDEIPVVLGFLVISGTVLGAAFESRFLWSSILLALPVPAMEILLHYGLVHAPYRASPLSTIVWIALLALLPSFAAVGLGTALRRVVKGRFASV